MTFSRQPDRPARPRIAIVGGGPGGLFTAWHLERLAATPLTITIFEADDRLGGKVRTPAFEQVPVRYEAGAAELYDYSPIDDDPLRELVRSLGLPTVAMHGSSVVMASRRLSNLDELAEAFGPHGRESLAAFDTWARSALTPAEFFAAGSDQATSAASNARFAAALATIADPGVRRYVEVMIKSDLATEPETTSVGYGLQNYLMNDPAYMRLYCIAGGNERLITALASRLAAEIRLEAAVTEIGGDAGAALDVSWLERGQPRQGAFDVVILALPLDALARITSPSPCLTAGLKHHVVHHDHPAHYLRITVLFDQPLPAAGGDDSYLMLDALGGCCLYIESSREPNATHGVLGWLIGGAAAVELGERTDEELVAAALETLPEPWAALRGRVLEAKVHRWRGAVSAVPGGWEPLAVDRRHRPAPASHPNLFVVGDYLYDATLNGVLDSAEHVAGWVAAELAEAWQER
ncbi:MAG: flavin monoamine oxidase family protein [Planctomycetota bacterium]